MLDIYKDQPQKPSPKIFKALSEWLEKTTGISGVYIEYLPTDIDELPALCIQTLSTINDAKVYKDGTRIHAYRFAVWYRSTIHERMQDHDKALEVYGRIQNAIGNHNTPEIEGASVWYMKVDASPAVYGAFELYEDYRADFTLEYRV